MLLVKEITSRLPHGNLLFQPNGYAKSCRKQQPTPGRHLSKRKEQRGKHRHAEPVEKSVEKQYLSECRTSEIHCRHSTADVNQNQHHTKITEWSFRDLWILWHYQTNWTKALEAQPQDQLGSGTAHWLTNCSEGLDSTSYNIAAKSAELRVRIEPVKKEGDVRSKVNLNALAQLVARWCQH